MNNIYNLFSKKYYGTTNFKKYYSTSLFRIISLAIFVLLFLGYLTWHLSLEAIPLGNDIPLIACIVLNMILLLFPTQKSIKLPLVLMPIITFVSMLIVQLALNDLPHNLRPFWLLWPVSVTLITCVILVLRDCTRTAITLYIVSALLVVKWHQNIFTSTLTILAEFFIPIFLLWAAFIFRQHISTFDVAVRKTIRMIKRLQSNNAQEQNISNIAAQRVQEVRTLTEEMLHRIAYNDAPITAEEIDDFRFTEAQLRDTIRGRYIANRPILNAALKARRRGAKVDILDERGCSLPEAVETSLTECAIDLLNNATGGTITIRAFPASDKVAVMIVHDGNHEDDESPSAIEIMQGTGEVIRF
ncbi:hypothetical protein ACN08Z_00695 [Rothia sp. P7181]|uniref:hypothetical protein n=1 Tax=unclassified Rothia (in: high G+C Gram-positive bacteria) TaxID=2689056 RepID=UPI003ACAAFC7